MEKGFSEIKRLWAKNELQLDTSVNNRKGNLAIVFASFQIFLEELALEFESYELDSLGPRIIFESSSI